LEQQLHGRIIKEQSGFYWVEANDGNTYMSRLRGKLKEDARSSDIASIGDWVTIQTVQEDGTDQANGFILSVEERRNRLSRAVRTTGKRGGGQAEREHILIANVDQIFLVFAVANPTPNYRMLDRLLVASEYAGVDNITLVLNKTDLIDEATVQTIAYPYEAMGYPIIQTSAHNNIGIDTLRDLLTDNVSVFSGPSGVGKTSLLNAIQPNLGRTVKEVSKTSGEGMHTTRDSALVKLDSGGYLADTPGIRQISVWDIEPDELDGYFRDIEPYATNCRFSNCTHTNEPGCAVIEAVEQGHIARSRYENYLLLRDELAETYIVYQR